MKKVRMIVEMDEELYKAFAEQDVFISGMRTGKTLLSEIWKALKSATIVRMSEEKIKESCSLSLVYNEGFDKGYKKAKTEYKPKECDDAVSRPYIESKVEELENICVNAPEEVLDLLADIKNAPPVKPKREENTVSEEVYTEEYTRRKALKYENYVLKQNMQALRCENEVK